MELFTDRLTLRPFRSEDWPSLYAYLRDPETVRFELYEPFTEDRSKQEAKRREADDAFIAVCENATGHLIGNLYFERRDMDCWELGYVFNRAYWHNGFATEAAQALLTYAFATLHAHRVFAECNPENTASVRLLQRLNMRQEGRLIANVAFRKHPETGMPLWQDTLVFAILADEWFSGCEYKTL